MHRIVVTARAERDLGKLDERTQRRIAEKLRQYSSDPLAYARKLVNPTVGTYRYRIGEFRVIFDIQDQDVIVMRVGNRKEIYR